MSEIMDTFLNLKHEGATYLTKIKQQNQCKSQYKCRILESMVKARQYGTRSQIPHSQKHFDSTLQIPVICKMELLDFVHVQLFHKEEHFRNRIPNRAGIDSFEDYDETDEKYTAKHQLLKDVLYNNSDLASFALFCQENDYDSEAIYDDIHPYQDGQSNIYWFFKTKVIDGIHQYDLLKDKFSKYTIRPIDEIAMTRNLIDLDFGDHITAWKVQSKFLNVKQEWTQNEFAPIDTVSYKSMYIKSEIIANQDHNKSSYKLSHAHILCIKMYTDTNELQREFRKSFRSSAEENRRSQFVHWATNFSIIFLNIEVLNELYHYDKHIKNHTLYHGLNRLFNTRGLVRQFHGVLSTTWDETSAQNFAGGNGMILQINKDANRTSAIAVDWISCHSEEREVLLMNAEVAIQKTIVFSNDIEQKSSYLKSILLGTINNQESNIMRNLSSFLQSLWIETSLEHVMQDKEFVHKIQLFTAREFLNGMSLLEMIFFECQQYQIAQKKLISQYISQKKLFEIIIGTDFLEFTNDNYWTQSVDRMKRTCSKYGLRMCKMEVTYQYKHEIKTKQAQINKRFNTKQGKQILLNPNLLLQYIDQTKLDKNSKGVSIYISMNIKYQYQYFDDDTLKKSDIRVWRYEMKNLKAIEFDREFNWKINTNTTFTSNALNCASLWITNASVIKCVPMNINSRGEFNILCEKNILIDRKCSISMSECGIQGAIYNDDEKHVYYQFDSKHNGKSNDSYGGGGQYLTTELREQNTDKIFSVGFGGGCAKIKGSEGGSGGGKINISCERLTIKNEGTIVSNGGKGKIKGGGGSGGSILIITNSANFNETAISVKGGKGDDTGGNGSDGIILYGESDKKTQWNPMSTSAPPIKLKMLVTQKKIRKWSNKDLCEWIENIGLSDKWQDTMIKTVENTGCR
eukprot:348061_1